MNQAVIASSVTLSEIQHSVVQPTIMQTNEGQIEVKPSHVDSSYITLKVVLVTGGEFDGSKTDALLAIIMEKLKEIEL